MGRGKIVLSLNEKKKKIERKKKVAGFEARPEKKIFIAYVIICPLRLQVMSHNLPPRVTTLRYNWNAFVNTLYTTSCTGEASILRMPYYANADVSERNKNHQDASSTC